MSGSRLQRDRSWCLSRVQNSWWQGYDITTMRASFGVLPQEEEPTPVKVTVPSSSRERSQLLPLSSLLALTKFQDTRAKVRASRLPVILGQEIPRLPSSKPESRKPYYAGDSSLSHQPPLISWHSSMTTETHTFRCRTLIYSIQKFLESLDCSRQHEVSSTTRTP